MTVKNISADLHVHTYYSDGVYSPEQAVDTAARIGLKAISITDHDCTDALGEAIAASGEKDIELIPGVEISARCEEVDIHILGYYIDWEDPALSSLLHRIRSGRIDRLRKTIERLAERGIKIDFNEVRDMSHRGSFGRMQLARAIVKKNLAPNVKTVFNKYISDNGPCYVPHRRVDYTEVIEAIRLAGGVAVLAHPGTMGKDDFIEHYIEAGLRGIEVYHAKHSNSAIKRYLRITGEKGLLVTGGSDCHGADPGKRPLLGSSGVDLSCVEKLRAEAREC